ncbi:MULTISPECIES: hypothetical protein [unclassified Streptomyces]|uniref:hypothetical protein n=1 Tax=unclassified Streptomyces TaxID=2593676 RepID=UPI00159FC05B
MGACPPDGHALVERLDQQLELQVGALRDAEPLIAVRERGELPGAPVAAALVPGDQFAVPLDDQQPAVRFAHHGTHAVRVGGARAAPGRRP